MTLNMLMLNDDKFEFIIFHSKIISIPASDFKISIQGVDFVPASHVKNLGVFQDSCLTMEKQINSTTRSCYHNIRKIGRIRHYITTDACRTLVQAMVTSRLDYANVLLHGLPQTLLGRLQKVQNCAARLIARSHRRDHITPVLKELHWLPVEFRSQYKILLYTYKALNGLAPSYISELLQPHIPGRCLRSASKNLLAVVLPRTERYGARSFRRSAPVAWNGLPDQLRDAGSLNVFKKHLKTHLFRLAYNL